MIYLHNFNLSVSKDIDFYRFQKRESFLQRYYYVKNEQKHPYTHQLFSNWGGGEKEEEEEEKEEMSQW